MKKASLIVFAILSVNMAYSQFQVQYIHTNPLKFNLDYFNKVTIMSTAPKSSVRVKYALLDEKDNKIVEIKFKLMELVQGVNRLNYNQGDLVWHNSPYADLLMKSQLVGGNFQLCVSVTDIYETLPEADECFEVELESIDIEDPLNAEPIELDEPEKNDSIEEIRPMLSWIPPSPTHKGTEYQLILVEKKENQSCTEALNNNLPIVNKKSIPTNIIGFPSESRALEKGHNYCWRVAAYKDLKEYSRSEDWKFTVKGKEITQFLPVINEIQDYIVYTVENEFEFALNLKHNIKNLNYEIYDLSNKVVLSSNDFPIKLSLGLNRILLDLSSLDYGVYKVVLLNIDNKKYEFNVKKIK